MGTAEAQIREWGGSLGLVIPNELVLQDQLKAGDTVEFILLKRGSVVREVFGKLKLKRSTDEILKEIDEEGWHV